MALARVVTFDGVNAERMEDLRRRIEEGDRPEGLPATELVILHDGEQAISIVFFDNEDDYAKGDEILGAMPAAETPGTRSSVRKYDVAVRMQAVT